MKKYLFAFAIIIILFSGCSVNMYQQAEFHYANYEFAAAARIYENILQSDSSNNIVKLHLADCYRRMNYDVQSEKCYASAINSPDALPEDKLHYAQVLKINRKYDLAEEQFESYVADHPKDMAAINQLKSCDSAAKLLLPSPFYEVEEVPLGFNGSCFCPAKFGNDLMVVAEVPVQPGIPLNNWTGNGFLDLYVVTENKQDPFCFTASTDGFKKVLSPKNLTVAKFPGEINSALHEGPAVITADQTKMYFTRSSTSNGKPVTTKDYNNHLEICSADLANGKWGNIKKIKFNTVEFSFGQPAISSDGKRLYFVSDKPGGYGGTDLYYSDLVNGEWGASVNAGSAVNTNGNEMFPTLREIKPGEEELYFSSDGLPGAGGLDIFKCEIKDGNLQSPERMPYPLNGSADDFGIIFTNDGKEGYFSSNRDSDKGIDKIYSFHHKIPAFYVDLTVLNKENKTPIAGVDIEIVKMKDSSVVIKKTDASGHLIFTADSITKYGFTLRSPEYFYASANAETGRWKNNFNDTTYASMTAEKIVINKSIRLDNIYYDYNKWAIRPDAAIELNKLVKIMLDNPQIKIELSSHTDARGSDKYNMTLSQKRAQSAVDYIVSQGISSDRITAKGYGESMPLNKCVNNVKCSEEEYQLNRRTEFKVTEIIKN